MYREIEGEDVILEKDPTYTLTEDGAFSTLPASLSFRRRCLCPDPHPRTARCPTLLPADIEQYASWLGMDLELDSHLFWIARAGLMTELPEDWKPCKSPDGEVYYFNFASGESQWDHPCDEEFRELYREQRQASILAAQQRLAWAACVWATGHVLPSSGGEVAAGRERERRVAAAKKRRRKAQNDTGRRRAHFAVSRPAESGAVASAASAVGGKGGKGGKALLPAGAKAPGAQPLVVEDLEEPEPQPEAEMPTAPSGQPQAFGSPVGGSQADADEEEETEGEAGKNSSPASPVKDVEESLGNDGQAGTDLTPQKASASGKGENTSPPKERSTSPLSVPNSPGSDGGGGGAGKLTDSRATSDEAPSEPAAGSVQ